MLRRILTLFQQDLTNALRDNILVYMMVGPLLLALAVRLFLPSLDRVTLTFAVQSTADPAFVERLRGFGRVELYPSREALEERVLRTDDVAGIVPGSGGYELLFEGNEGEDPQAMARLVEGARSGTPLAAYDWQLANSGRSLITEYGAMVMILISVLLGALVMAFLIIEDKETRAARALGVSPLSILEMTFARGLFAVGLGYLLTIGSTLIILGPDANLGLLTVGFLASLGLPVLIGFLIGGLADSQLKAIALLKFVMLVYLTLPIVSAFLPRSLHPFFYLLPNYWMWTVLENVFIGQLGAVGFRDACAITLAMSMVLLAFAMPQLRKQLALR